MGWLWPCYSLAESNQLPRIMRSYSPSASNGLGVTLETDSGRYYGGFNGNEAIINEDINLLSSGELLGFSSSRLTEVAQCNSIGWATRISDFCFLLNTSSTSIRLFTSRTMVNGAVASETAAIYYPALTAIGDVYSGDGNLSNFALYGRNLAQTKGAVSTNAQYGTWNTDAYTLNPQAQASYAEDQKIYFDTHYNQLFGEATKVDDINANIFWGLQREGMVRTGGSISSLYPEGAVWKNTDSLSPKVNLILDSSHQIIGKGTIIVNGNLTVKNGKNIQKWSGDDSYTLGLIVLGNVTLEGNNNIEAAIFSTENIKIGNNVNMTGSFVAKNFCATGGASCSSLANSYGIRISYDYRLEDNWPPGFRYFNMPSAENAAP